jgi:putative ABC transport system permease protein
VERAAGVYRAPLQGPIGLDSGIHLEGDPPSTDVANLRPRVNAESVTPGYFSAMRIPILAGRAFTAEDRELGPPVAIASQSLARHLWPGEVPLGKRLLAFGRQPLGDPLPWVTIVGVAADVRYREIEEPRLDLYMPVTQANAPVHDIVVRTSGDPLALVPAVRAIAARLNSGAPIDARTLQSMVDAATAVWRMTLVAVGSFGVFALLLSAGGLYGLFSQVAHERTGEIGVRTALGATPRHVRQVFAGDVLRLMLVGLMAGAAAWLPASALLRGAVFNVSPLDPVAMGSAALVLVVSALLATFVPVRRAAAIDPMSALRQGEHG